MDGDPSHNDFHRLCCTHTHTPPPWPRNCCLTSRTRCYGPSTTRAIISPHGGKSAHAPGPDQTRQGIISLPLPVAASNCHISLSCERGNTYIHLLRQAAVVAEMEKFPAEFQFLQVLETNPTSFISRSLIFYSSPFI